MRPVVSIVIDHSARYGQVSLDPTASFPEIASGIGDNGCYAMVRQTLAAAGLDAEHFGTDEWNPLGRWIRRDDRVFVLPNHVVHRRPEETMDDFLGKVTHGSVLRPVLDYAFIANGDATRISLGNAPLQGCDYPRVIAESQTDLLGRDYRTAHHADIGPHDLRKRRTTWTRFGAMTNLSESDEETVEFDLGRASCLEPLFKSRESVPVRVGDYPPEATMAYHGPGRHVYVVNRRVLEANVIISVPKLKTHQKVGMTCAMKGTVGAIARKECLAHHRKGGPGRQGDEYPDDSLIRRIYSELTDKADGAGTGVTDNAVRITAKMLGRLVSAGKGIRGGGWYGNDTAWRMVVDIVRILRYGRVDGTMASEPQRHHLVFIDGVIAGEGDGPLRPRGRRVGAIMFGSEPLWTDVVAARFIGFDDHRMQMLEHSKNLRVQPITDHDESDVDVRVILNGEPSSLREVVTPLVPSKGWISHIERA